MYAQGRVVKDQAGRTFLHWPRGLSELDVPASTVSRVLPGLLEAECLVEHPGTRERAGRLWPTYSAPLVEPVSRTALEELRFPFLYREGTFTKMEHAPQEAPNLALPAAGFESAGFEPDDTKMEHAPGGGASSKMEHAPEAAGARSHVRGQEQHQQQATGRTSSSRHLPPADTAPSPNVMPPESEEEIAGLCLQALKAIGVGKPENVMRQFPLNSIAGALEALVMKLSRGEGVQGKGAPYVMWFLVEKAEFAPVEDFGFLRYWSQEADPKVVQFPLRRRG
jgi:hypothetical protein